MTTAHRRPSRFGRVRRRFRRPVVLLFAAAFFFAPLTARLTGQHAVEFENHALARFPSMSSWNFFSKFNTWSIDHLPLRQYAVRGDANLSHSVFGEVPQYGGNADPPQSGIGTKNGQRPQPASGNAQYTDVIVGKDGWLFFGGDAAGACKPRRPISQELALINQLGKAITASGRRFIFTVAPDKTTMYPNELPDSFYGKDCMNSAKKNFWQRISAKPPTGYLDLRTALKAQQDADGVPIYRKSDTHWGPRGGVVFAQQLADRLQPGLWKGTTVTRNGNSSQRGDLSILDGRPTNDVVPSWKVQRPGVRLGYKIAPHPLAKPVTVVNHTSPGGVNLFDQKTLLLGDSFTDASRSDLLPLFKRVTILHNTSSVGYPDKLTQAFVDNDVIVLEVVERSVVGGGVSLIGPTHLPSLIAALRAHPLH